MLCFFKFSLNEWDIQNIFASFDKVCNAYDSFSIFDRDSLEITFSVDDKIENLIGQLYVKNFGVKKLLNMGNYKLSHFGENFASEIFYFSNKNLFVFQTNSSSRSLELGLYDEDFKLIKTISLGNYDNRLTKIKMVSNEEETEIYVYYSTSPVDDETIILTRNTENFEKTKSINFKQAKEQFGFTVIYCMCFRNNRLYVGSNKINEMEYKIIEFDGDLKLLRSFDIHYQPYEIKASNSIICIKNQENSVYFYKMEALLNEFLKKEHDKCCIFADKSTFYVFEYFNNKLFTYENNCAKIRDITLVEQLEVCKDDRINDASIFVKDRLFIFKITKRTRRINSIINRFTM